MTADVAAAAVRVVDLRIHTDRRRAAVGHARVGAGAGIARVAGAGVGGCNRCRAPRQAGAARDVAATADAGRTARAGVSARSAVLIVAIQERATRLPGAVALRGATAARGAAHSRGAHEARRACHRARAAVGGVESRIEACLSALRERRRACELTSAERADLAAFARGAARAAILRMRLRVDARSRARRLAGRTFSASDRRRGGRGRRWRSKRYGIAARGDRTHRGGGSQKEKRKGGKRTGPVRHVAESVASFTHRGGKITFESPARRGGDRRATVSLASSCFGRDRPERLAGADDFHPSNVMATLVPSIVLNWMTTRAAQL